MRPTSGLHDLRSTDLGAECWSTSNTGRLDSSENCVLSELFRSRVRQLSDCFACISAAFPVGLSDA